MHRTAVIVGAGQAGLAMSRCLDGMDADAEALATHLAASLGIPAGVLDATVPA